MDALVNKLFASLSQIIILLLHCLANLEDVHALLFPNAGDWSVVRLQHFKFKFHLIHLIDNLLCFLLLLIEPGFYLIYILKSSLLCVLKSKVEVFLRVLKMLNLLVFFCQRDKQFVSIDIIKKFNFLDLVLQLFESFLLTHFVLCQPTTISLHISDFLLQFTNHFFCCCKTLLSELKFLLHHSLPLLPFCHLFPEISIVRLLLS